MFEKIGRFEIKGVLGRGAMGEVYLGIDPAIGREVAIKTILPSAAKGDEAKNRFTREAKAAGILNHPNLVTIYDFGEDQGVLFIVMERVNGQDFEELLQQQSVSRADALEILAQVCDGLEFAHRNHIIHRDIKPSNVKVARDGRRIHVKVMDFGVARLKNSEMTATGTIVGTVSYMAPEYIRTGKADSRSDLFAVGVMLYESMSGRKPFDGETTPTILYRIINDPPDPIDLSELKDISPAIRSVLDTALAKNPDERYQSAGEFARALRAAKDPTWQGQSDDGTIRLKPAIPLPQPTVPANSNAATTVTVRSVTPRRPRGWMLAAAAGLLGLMVMISGGYLLFRTVMKPRLAALSEAASPKQAGASMEDAVALVDSDPGKALTIFQQISLEHPEDANAYAWVISMLYELKRYNEIPAVLRMAKKNGVTSAQMKNNIRFRMVMFNDKQAHLIPPGNWSGN